MKEFPSRTAIIIPILLMLSTVVLDHFLGSYRFLYRNFCFSIIISILVYHLSSFIEPPEEDWLDNLESDFFTWALAVALTFSIIAFPLALLTKFF
jgi:hypothetical protein